MRLVDDVPVFPALELGLLLVGPLQIIEVLEEQNPGGLLGVVEFRGAAGLFPQNIVDVFESLFEHGRYNPHNAPGDLTSVRPDRKGLMRGGG